MNVNSQMHATTICLDVCGTWSHIQKITQVQYVLELGSKNYTHIFVFGSKRDKGRGYWKKLHNVDCHVL